MTEEACIITTNLIHVVKNIHKFSPSPGVMKFTILVDPILCHHCYFLNSLFDVCLVVEKKTLITVYVQVVEQEHEFTILVDTTKYSVYLNFAQKQRRKHQFYTFEYKIISA